VSVPDTVFDALPPEPYGSVRPIVRDGDLLLCSAYDAGSRVIRWATRSLWSHVAIAFRMSEIDRVMVLECVEHIGVRAVPLSDFVTRTSSGTKPYPGRILLARHRELAANPDHPVMKRMSAFAFDRLGDKFSSREMLKIALRIALGRLGRSIPQRIAADDEYICSEYVARCYEAVGLPIQWDGQGFIAPADIAADPRILPVAQISTRAGVPAHAG
jgi:hypothetical protein